MSISPTSGVSSSYFGNSTPTASTSTTGSQVQGTFVNDGSVDTSSTTTLASTSTTDKNMFLKLMVAQLKNQDPMNPTDSTQFLAQTAQFTSLEKLTDVADQSSQALSAQLAFGASGLVGKTVNYNDATGAEKTGAVDSVRFTSSGPIVSIGGTDVTLDSVTGVAKTPTTSTTSTTT